MSECEGGAEGCRWVGGWREGGGYSRVGGRVGVVGSVQRGRCVAFHQHLTFHSHIAHSTANSTFSIIAKHVPLLPVRVGVVA